MRYKFFYTSGNISDLFSMVLISYSEFWKFHFLEFENVNARFSVTGKGAWLEDNSD